LSKLNSTINSFKKKGKKDKANLLDLSKSKEKEIFKLTAQEHKRKNGLSLTQRVIMKKKSRKKLMRKNRKF